MNFKLQNYFIDQEIISNLTIKTINSHKYFTLVLYFNNNNKQS